MYNICSSMSLLTSVGTENALHVTSIEFCSVNIIKVTEIELLTLAVPSDSSEALTALHHRFYSFCSVRISFDASFGSGK